MATLRWLNPGVYIRKAQLDIIDFFNIPDALKQRGFQEVTEASLSTTLREEKRRTEINEGALIPARAMAAEKSKSCVRTARLSSAALAIIASSDAVVGRTSSTRITS